MAEPVEETPQLTPTQWRDKYGGIGHFALHKKSVGVVDSKGKNVHYWYHNRRTPDDVLSRVDLDEIARQYYTHIKKQHPHAFAIKENRAAEASVGMGGPEKPSLPPYPDLPDLRPIADGDKGGAVMHPKHYNTHPSGVECKTIIRHMPFNSGCVVKYLWREGQKEGQTSARDFNKALFYLLDEMNRLGHKITVNVTEFIGNESKE